MSEREIFYKANSDSIRINEVDFSFRRPLLQEQAGKKSKFFVDKIRYEKSLTLENGRKCFPTETFLF